MYIDTQSTLLISSFLITGTQAIDIAIPSLKILENASLAPKNLFHRQSGPRCPANGEQSSFFIGTQDQFRVYQTNADPRAVDSLGELPDDLSDFPSCDPEPNTQFNFYPQPPEDSSDCARRDQEVRYRLLRALVDINPGPLQPYFTQNPNDFPSDPEQVSEYCATNTVTYQDFNDLLAGLQNAYSAVLDAVDYQTCLIGMDDTSLTYNYIFDHPRATAEDTRVYGVLHALDTSFFYLTQRGETLDAQGAAIKASIENRFDQTKNFMASRRDCTSTVKSRCEDLGIPLQDGLIKQVLDLVTGLLGGEVVCPPA
ncbi:hypothetical protein ABW19_dt0207437 [Dactylella cylindrospora]|nr:hypothetical protein ABW19_dt0207437 [Dactylella cylindrospora]